MGSLTVASYDYLGMGALVGQTLDQAQLNTSVFTLSSGTYTYGNLDNFNRPNRSHWDRIGGRSFYDTSVSYDYNSNITGTVDNVHINQTTSKHLFDVAYTNDLLNRLRAADEGNASAGVIQTGYHTRTESWPNLTLTGNWTSRKLDANGDGDFTDASDLNESNTTFSPANEWTGRRARSAPTQDDYAYTYDAVGNLTLENKTVVNGSVTSLLPRGYQYDAFGRLTAVTGQATEDGPTYIAKYRYNGLGFRTMWQYDVNANGTLEDSERYYFAYDERWRIIATYRNQDSSGGTGGDKPKERFVYHAAGMAGMGGSSYIDSVVLRDRDQGIAWTAAGTGNLDERRYYCQNWRGDVVAITKSTGVPLEYVRYSSYGEPTVYPVADINMDGKVDSVDLQTWLYIQDGEANHGAYTPDLDFNDDPDPLGDDDSLFQESYTANNGKSGIGKVSSDAIANRVGYAAYQWDPTIAAFHVRYRVYKPESGRWTRRDPASYQDGMNLYAYADDIPLYFVDAFGLSVDSETQKHLNACADCFRGRKQQEALEASLFMNCDPGDPDIIGWTTSKTWLFEKDIMKQIVAELDEKVQTQIWSAVKWRQWGARKAFDQGVVDINELIRVRWTKIGYGLKIIGAADDVWDFSKGVYDGDIYRALKGGGSAILWFVPGFQVVKGIQIGAQVAGTGIDLYVEYSENAAATEGRRKTCAFLKTMRKSLIARNEAACELCDSLFSMPRLPSCGRDGRFVGRP